MKAYVYPGIFPDGTPVGSVEGFGVHYCRMASGLIVTNEKSRFRGGRRYHEKQGVDGPKRINCEALGTVAVYNSVIYRDQAGARCCGVTCMRSRTATLSCYSSCVYMCSGLVRYTIRTCTCTWSCTFSFIVEDKRCV